MAGHTPWKAIRARKGPETPEQAALGEAIGRAMDEALRVAHEHEAGATLVEVADPPGGEPGTRRDELYLATLRGYVEELGGRLVLTAVFPDQPGAVGEPDGAAVPAMPAVGQDH